MGAHVSRTDFEWTNDEEPHASRRKLILAKYPQIKKLFDYDPNFKWLYKVVCLFAYSEISTDKEAVRLRPQLQMALQSCVSICLQRNIRRSRSCSATTPTSNGFTKLCVYLFTAKYPQIKKLFGYDPNFKWLYNLCVYLFTAKYPQIKKLFGYDPNFKWLYKVLRVYLFTAKYPQIKKLFGYDPNFKWQVTGMVFVQFAMMWVVKDQSWPVMLLVAYCFGGVISHSLMLAIHELSHNLAFGHSRPLANRMLGFFANLPIGFPFSVSFKKYHLEHHRYQGDELKDTDIPTYVEAKLFCTTFGKFCWVCLQPFFYALRPIITYPKPPNRLEVINVVIQLAFDYLVVRYFGWHVMAYMVGGSLLAMGIHPVAGHFISEHYMFKKGYETYSYYGCLNAITFNVGYHNEHHDFPAVPGSRLPEVRRIAPEFYDNLPHHDSWTAVLRDFIMDPDIGPYARIRRKHKGLDT